MNFRHGSVSAEDRHSSSRDRAAYGGGSAKDAGGEACACRDSSNSSSSSGSSSGNGMGMYRIAPEEFQLAGGTKAVFSFTAVVWSWIVVSDSEIILAAGLSKGFYRVLYDSGRFQASRGAHVPRTPQANAPKPTVSCSSHLWCPDTSL